MESKLDLILNELGNLHERVTSIDKKVANIDERVTSIENNMATKEDVADIPAIKQASLEVSEKINNLVDEKASEINALNKRLFKVESFIERLNNQ